jgi:transcriptional regulator with XRE-family HTH domain
MATPGGTLGEIIRRQREINEISMRQLATLAGISNPYLSQIERGLRAPSEKVLEAIAETLETSVDRLYEQAGYAPDGDEDEEPGLAQAIRDDPYLSPRQRQAMLEVYAAFRATGASPRRPKRRRQAEESEA